MKYEVEECIGSKFRGISRKIDAIYRKHLEGTNITENQLSIMLALSKTGKIEQIEIGRILNLERSSMSRNLTRLIDQGFIHKEGAVNRPLISLSKDGLQKVTSLMPSWERAMDEVTGMLDEKALAGFKNFELAINKE